MGLIPAGVEVGEDISLRILLIIGSTTDVLNNGLDSSVIEVKNCWRKIEIGQGGEERLSMIATGVVPDQDEKNN